METKQQTKGEKMVGIDFNPSGNPEVDKIKRISAEMIDTVIHKAENMNVISPSDSLFINNAISQIVTAQMWAVKVLTLK